MAVYNSLLLSQGGGIVSKKSLSPRYPGSAALAIGIGGTGMRALWKLKQKVYAQIQPDSSSGGVKRYDHIQFLVIDSDSTEIASTAGEAQIDPNSEFCNISDSQLSVKLSDPDEVRKIKENPLLNWFDVDHARMQGIEGAGGIRQVGRFLLFSNVNKLLDQLNFKITEALTDQNPPALDIYIFAGISGGTGSGTFIDTCYLIKSILKDRGIAGDAKTFGMFFLPDVPTSKPAVAANAPAKRWNASNGYAAMRELDYLMHLKEAGERFQQNWGSCQIDTDEPPVNMCHLFSATNAQGTIVQDGFNVALNAAADLVMSYLSDVQLTILPGKEPEQTIRGSMANIDNGVTGLKPQLGADLTYHIVGTSEAEIPMTQFLTYLGCGFFDKVSAFIDDQTKMPIASDADALAKQLGFKDEFDLKQLVESGSDELHVDDFSRNLDGLREYGLLGRNEFPVEWIQPKQEWIDSSAGKRKRNAANLLSMKGDFDWDHAKHANGSLIAKVFDVLCQISCDYNRGPRYAASLLHGGQRTFQSYLDGIVEAAGRHAAQDSDYANQMLDKKFDANQRFMHPGFFESKKGLARTFYENSMDHFNYLRSAEAWRDTAEAANDLRDALDAMYAVFFKPLVACLDSLSQTFKANSTWLATGQGSKAPNGCIHILDLADVKPLLDAAINQLQGSNCVTELVRSLIINRQCWSQGNEPALKELIDGYVLSLGDFTSVAQTTIDNFLAMKYLAPGLNVQTNQGQLVKNVESKVINKMHAAAEPMFWARQTYNITGAGVSYPFCNISVPSCSGTLKNAANSCKAGTANQKSMQVRLTGSTDRISVVRYYSGVPFFSYVGVSNLKKEYDNSINTMFGACAHLYANTGRGGADDHDWRKTLPTPMPYSEDPSFFPDADEIESLFADGYSSGIIQDNPNGTCSIVYSDKPDLAGFVPDACVGNDGKIDMPRWTRESDALKKLLADRIAQPMYSMPLKSAGDPAFYNTIVKDYFFHYRQYQDTVHNELEARKALQSKIEAYDAFYQESQRFDADMAHFAHTLFMGRLECLDVQGRPDTYTLYLREVNLAYLNSRGVQQKAVLAGPGDAGAFKDHPLYRAFESYCALPANQEPRLSLEKQVDSHFAGYMTAGVDNRVAYTLQTVFTPAQLGAIQRDSLQKMTLPEHESLMQFYTRLMGEVNDFEQLFTPADWAQGGVVAPGATTSDASQAAPITPGTTNMWTCNCGTQNTGKFCTYCGDPKPTDAPKPTGEWACCCGQAHNTGNFCMNCGHPKPTDEWMCNSCGSLNTGKFCSQCGSPQPDAMGEA